MANELGTFIAAEVTRAEADFQAFRSKALNIVGVAGGLATLVGGFLAIAAGSRKDFLPTSGRLAVLVAVAAYVLAATVALLMNLPVKLDEPTPQVLLNFAESEWDDEGWEKRVAEVSAKYLVSIRKSNEAAAKYLIAGIGFEILGIAATAVMGALVVQNLP